MGDRKRRWSHEGASRKAMQRAAGQAKESRLQQRARSKEAGAVEALERLYELLSLQ